MKPEEIAPLLPLAAADLPEPLPGDFAATVLRRARRFRVFSRRHWRLLFAASSLAAGLAAAVAAQVGREARMAVPPFSEFGSIEAGFAPPAYLGKRD